MFAHFRVGLIGNLRRAQRVGGPGNCIWVIGCNRLDVQSYNGGSLFFPFLAGVRLLRDFSYPFPDEFGSGFYWRIGLAWVRGVSWISVMQGSLCL